MVKSAGDPHRLCWPLVSLVAKAAGSSIEQATGNHGLSCCIANTGSPALFFVPCHLYMSQLCQSLGEKKLKWVLHVVP